MIIYEFAIRKETTNGGTEILTPVVRIKRRFFPNPWQRITCLYGEYKILDLDFTPQLTYDQCVAHITGYQLALKQQTAHVVIIEEYHQLEQYKTE